ncbi:GTP-binding protein [Bacillus sp. V3B]|uniref:CobW family GTP-binding protein n=1 Tax=Bacillus sp. V3B TaxID=2804915 RepID=UPI00210C098F|nr:GTP-binding protein [Bacillus sp. V3B]MCQ6275847.1 GTP-binding protein [Bacillus sp. V3B]
MIKKIPVYVISGFLGSGKTTVLLNMIKECERNNKRPGIILNELGEVNVESYLFENQHVKELLNGCICCTIQDDLKETLNHFIVEIKKNNIDVLFIEGTGVANPVEIEEALISPEFLNYFELYSMISLVDASHFLEFQSIFSSTTEVRKLLREQISSATIVLLNKLDLVKEKSLIKIEHKIKENVKSSVPIYKTKFGEISIKELFLKRYYVHTSQSQKENILKCSHVHNDDNRMDEHKHHDHHSTINAFRIDKLPEMNKRKLETWLKSLPKAVLRGKGIVKLEGSIGLFNFQFSSGNMILDRIRETPYSQPTIILIGDKLNTEEILHSFNRTFKTKIF